MIYDTKIKQADETVRTWFERGVNRLHRLHRLFSCQRKLFLPTDSTKNTKFFLVNRFLLSTENTKNTNFSLVNRFLLPTENTKNTKFLFGQQITQITQKINFVLFVSSVGKRKIICVICVICWQKKPCYPHGQQSLAKVKFSTYYSPLNQYMLFVLLAYISYSHMSLAEHNS